MLLPLMRLGKQLWGGFLLFCFHIADVVPAAMLPWSAGLSASSLQKLIEDLSNVSKMDAPLSLRPATFSVTLSPLK
jgi:hypothetical protein